jgi:hypothetical protein
LHTGRIVKVKKSTVKCINSATMVRWPPSIISMSYCMSMSRLHAHNHAACPCPSCMPISMLHARVHAACPYPCCMPVSMLHAYVCAACTCPCCMPMSILHIHVHAACPCPCCMFMPMPMLHVHAHAACVSTDCIALDYEVCNFLKGECLQTHYAVISLIAKILEVMVMICQPP